MRLASSSLRRPGFTLVEVIVAAGLCMLIMSVLAGAFAAGIDTFSLLKSTGELNDRLALGKEVMTGDLSAVHLEDDTGLPLRVSQVRYDAIGSQDSVVGRYAKPPARGFFRIIQEGVSTPEGVDPDNIPSTFATNHVLHMTVRRTPDQPAKAFLARVPNPNPNATVPNNTASNPADAWTSDRKTGSTGPMNQTSEYPAPTPATAGRRIGDFGYRLQHECLGALSGIPVGTSDRSFASPWAEVAYFLRDSGTTTTGTAPKPLFSLHRRIRLLAKNDNSLTQLNWAPYQTAAPGISCAPGTKNLNGPGDITNPINRMGGLLGTRTALATGANIDTIGPVADAAGNMTGEDILLTNVISFEVKVSWDAGLSFFTNPGNLNPNTNPVRNPLLVRSPGNPEVVRNVLTLPAIPAPTPIPLATADTPTPEVPFDDLPLAPSVERGYSGTDGSMNTHNFPNGSGNSNFARWFTNATYQAGRRVFDTWTTAQLVTTGGAWNESVFENPANSRNWQPNPNYVPLPIRVKAIQIKLRIYDPKNHLTRQITFVQDL